MGRGESIRSRRRRPGIVLLGVVAAAASCLVLAETVHQHPDERLDALVREVVDVINVGDPEELVGFVREHYGENMFGDMPVEAHAAFLKNVHDGKGPLELCCFRLSDRIPDNMAVATLRSRDDVWLSLQLRFDDDDRITSFMIVATRPPTDFVELEKLDDAGLARELDDYLTELERKDEFSGTVLVARDGVPLFRKAYGLASREFGVPNRLDTRFGLGSMNKMFTAVAIAQLVEQGKLSFDDPIGEHLPPGWVSPEVGEKVRIRHLLNHTSGFGDYLEPFLEQNHEKFRSLDDYREIVAGETLAFEPGSRWVYSNTGFLLLGVILQEVSGQDYYDYIRENIYLPAGMKYTDHYDITRVVPNVAEGYWKEDGEWRRNILLRAPVGTSAGGGYSTVDDLLAFDVALRSGKLVTAAMWDRLVSPDPERNSPGYGYGFILSSPPPDREVGHGGTYYGVSARLSMFLDSGYTFVALCNGMGAQTAYAKVLSLIARVK
ncbi:MAG: serine hydrolase domain-containing protein [Acidobacteriota bacterium]